VEETANRILESSIEKPIEKRETNEFTPENNKKIDH